jgi:hypothetical protein
MALLSFRGISTPSLPAQGEQRRSSYFNIPRGNSMFGIFQRSDAMLSAFVPIDGFQLLGVALPIFLFLLWARSQGQAPDVAMMRGMPMVGTA